MRIKSRVALAPSDLWVIIAAPALIISTIREPDHRGIMVLLGILFLCFLMGGVIIAQSASVELTSSSLIIHGLGRHREFAWSSIQRLEIKRERGVTRLILHCSGSRTVVLPAPEYAYRWQRARFQSELSSIRLWWERHGASGTTPDPTADS